MIQTLMYGVPSGCSFGSIVALEWLGEPYRLCRIEMPAVVTSDAYRTINPLGETPTLVTAKGERINESMAILNHLGARGIDKGLSFPQGTSGFDRLNQMLAFLNTSFFAAFGPLWHALEHGAVGSEKDVLRAYGAAQVTKAHTNLNALLGSKEWLLGEQRTLADAYFIGIARWTKYHDVVDRRDYPGLQRLFEKLEADPAVQFAHAIERGEKAAGTGGFRGEMSLDDFLRQQALAA
ncbi:glutathione S-transferase family protein [Microvirga lotononidis]|uniref:Glutathione S-transferase n=1 Tax=Microvirga lotononidis TaxID=864069 RepID=I4YMB7_9HYPH|nr:glutathione S-transferase family protein [Microvirga lotononidis]EIM25109.1 glutathione S-transferase [Microvirga lotononidis]WQO29400.1 glutathione S-transferase family protein [Microvirga lotononidis]